MTTRAEIDAADHRGADIFFSALTSFFDLSKLKALDMFARDGALTVVRYYQEVASLDVWELNPEHREKLEFFEPRDVKIGCSYKALAACDEKFDLIVVDTPQGVYTDGDGKAVAEHFQLMPMLPKIMNDTCIVVFYVNKQPYDRDKVGDYGNDSYDVYNWSQWMQARAQFYQTGDGRSLDEMAALNAYRRVFGRKGFFPKEVLITPCYAFADGLPPSFRCAIKFQRA